MALGDPRSTYGLTYAFDSTSERNDFLTRFFPDRKAAEWPSGKFEVEDGEFRVYFEEVSFFGAAEHRAIAGLRELRSSGASR